MSSRPTILTKLTTNDAHADRLGRVTTRTGRFWRPEYRPHGERHRRVSLGARNELG